MSGYSIKWITEYLAVGHAPMSFDDLETVKKEGIHAIINLCEEFCDLHEIQERTGFEVYYFPIPDECAPDATEMEKALSWLEEAVRQKKRILVHCRFGIGRTGTFVTAYLLRKGYTLKEASKKLKATGATPSSHSQWRFIRRFKKTCA